MGNSRRFEQTSQQNLPTVLFLVLVAVTGFIVGNQYKPTTTSTAGEIDTTQAETNPVFTELQSALSGSAENSSTSQPIAVEDNQPIGLVNINTASQSELDTLPGIGPSYAKAIIDYRTKNGSFVRLEDIQQVKGIGPKTFEKLKDKITL